MKRCLEGTKVSWRVGRLSVADVVMSHRSRPLRCLEEDDALPSAQPVDVSCTRFRFIASEPLAPGDRVWVYLYSSTRGSPFDESTPLTLRFDLAGAVRDCRRLETMAAHFLVEIILDEPCHDVVKGIHTHLAVRSE